MEKYKIKFEYVQQVETYLYTLFMCRTNEKGGRW